MLKDGLVSTILVIYLKTDLLKLFNLNLSYILIKALDFDNQDNTLYKTFYEKFIDILLSINFLIANNRNKLKVFGLEEMVSD